VKVSALVSCLSLFLIALSRILTQYTFTVDHKVFDGNIHSSVKGNKREREEGKQSSKYSRASLFCAVRMLNARGVIFLKGAAFNKSHLRTGPNQLLL